AAEEHLNDRWDRGQRATGRYGSLGNCRSGLAQSDRIDYKNIAGFRGMARNSSGLGNREASVLIHDNAVVANAETQDARGSRRDVHGDAVPTLTGALHTDDAGSRGRVVGNLEVDLAVGRVEQWCRLIVDEDLGSCKICGERQCTLLRSAKGELFSKERHNSALCQGVAPFGCRVVHRTLEEGIGCTSGQDFELYRDSNRG